MRRFNLLRLEDESGVSGIGIVTEGVVFTDGTVSMRWLTETSSVAFYQNIEQVIKIHGHSGRTIVQWVDEVV